MTNDTSKDTKLHLVIEGSELKELGKVSGLKLNLNGHKKHTGRNLYKKQLNMFKRMLG